VTRDAAIATNRFGLGARPGDLALVGSDPRGWLLAQLEPERELPAPLAALPSSADDQLAFAQWLRGLGRGVLRQSMTETDGAMKDEDLAGVESAFVREFVPRYEQALEARVLSAVRTERPFYERLVHFWSNHFVVSAIKPATVAVPPSFEREVVRPRATARFLDLLLASTQHPGMLVYLDNFQSIGPSSRRARRGARRRGLLRAPSGLNENLAREILELHTLGVHGGYTQADVTSFAKVLTGWGVERAGFVRRKLFRTDGFSFERAAHEPGAQTLLGKRYAQNGVEQGEAVLADLARHPSTARFVATKLARHFVADDPPAPVVERVAKTFRETDGDLARVARALVESPEAWQGGAAKLKTPEEYVISAARALRVDELEASALHRSLAQMGQRPYWAPSPAGFPDVASEWLGSDALWKRVQWAIQASQRTARLNPDPAEVAQQALGPLLRPETLAGIRAAQGSGAGLALLLASPEFQRR
jgi:uncharacterized protein (DUF1800 family)